MLPKVYERNKLARDLNCGTSTLRTYLCRADFWHVRFEKINNKKMYYIGLTPKDLEILKKYVNRTKVKTSKKSN